MTSIAVESSPRLSVLISNLRTLPPLPAGIARLLTLDQARPEYFEEATKIITSDPALAAEVVKLANSALFRGEGELDRLDHALLRVGTHEVVGALTVSFLRRVFVPTQPALNDVWLTNLASALVCREIASDAPELELVPETAFTYALLHDIGRLVMVAHFPEEMADLAAEWPHPLLVLPSREQEVFGFSHEMAGRLLANRWRFPSGLTQVISAHHLPPEDRRGFAPAVDRMIDLVNVGDCVADTLRGAEEITDDLRQRVRQDLERDFLSEILERLPLRPEAILGGLQGITDGMVQQQQAFGL